MNLEKGSTFAKASKRVMASSALMLIASACGGHDPKVTLPSRTPPAGPTAGSPSRSASSTTPQAAVVAAYISFFPAVNQALQATPERSRSILQDYAAGDYLDFEIRQVMDHQARHLEPWGKTVVHVTKLEINRDVAKVHDCQDASNAGLADARTHQVVPQSRGNAHRNLIAEMKLGSDGRWRLTDLKQYRAVCHSS